MDHAILVLIHCGQTLTVNPTNKSICCLLAHGYTSCTWMNSSLRLGIGIGLVSTSLGLTSADEHEVVVHLIEPLFVCNTRFIIRNRNTVVLLTCLVFYFKDVLRSWLWTLPSSVCPTNDRLAGGDGSWPNHNSTGARPLLLNNVLVDSWAIEGSGPLSTSDSF